MSWKGSCAGSERRLCHTRGATSKGVEPCRNGTTGGVCPHRVARDGQQEYRQNQEQGEEAAGMVVGGAKQRQQRRQSQQQAAAQSQQQGSQAFDSCMSARGYTVQP